MFTKILVDKMDKKSQQQQQQKSQQQQQQHLPKSKMAIIEAAPSSTVQTKPQSACTTTTPNPTKLVSHATTPTQTPPQNSKVRRQAGEQMAAPAETPAVVTGAGALRSVAGTSVRYQYAAEEMSASPAPCGSNGHLVRAASINRYYGGGGGRTASGTPATHAAVPATVAASGITVLSQMQKANEPRPSRRNAVKDLSTIYTRAGQAQALGLGLGQGLDKNEEALRELQESIPEIGKIFDVHCRIGSGTFSTVLLGTLQRERSLAEAQRRRFAIKHHNPTNHPERILRELECMFKIGGVDNVIGINCCIRYNDNVAFVMPYMSHDRFHDIYRHLSVDEVRDYLRNLLIALRHVHKFNVIHRDVKPSNILYNRRTRQFLLCDFGLAQHIAADGTVIQAMDLGAAAASALLRDMEAARQVMLQGGGAATTTFQGEADRIALVKEQETARRLRALGGGGGVDHPLEATHFSPPIERKPQPLATLTKKEHALQKADTMRLINRLRSIAANVDPNNYVVPTNAQRKEVHASRAGTPGYRPPEVLLRYPLQSTAVDVWAAGVIMLSLLSSLHPFFKAPNDCSALSEIMNLFGDISVRKTAFMLDRLVLLTQKVNALDLRRVCNRFRYADCFLAPDLQRRYRHADGTIDLCRNCEQTTFNCICKHTSHHIESHEGVDMFPLTAYDLLSRLLEVNPLKRITADEALKHPFFSEEQQGAVPEPPRPPRRETLPKTVARTLKPYVGYPMTVKHNAKSPAGGGNGNGNDCQIAKT